MLNTSKLIASFLLLFSCISTGATDLPDSSKARLKIFNDVVNSDLDGKSAMDSLVHSYSWELKSFSREEYHYIIEKSEEKAAQTSLLENKFHWLQHARHCAETIGLLGKTVVYYERLIAIASAQGNTLRERGLIHQLSWVYFHNDMLDESIDTYSKFFHKVEPDYSNYDYNYLCWNYGFFLSNVGWKNRDSVMLDSAVFYQKKYYLYMKESTDEHGNQEDVEGIITYAMALARANRREEAIAVAKRGLKLSENYNNVLYQSRFSKQLANYYAGLRDEENAYKYLRKYTQYEEQYFGNVTDSYAHLEGRVIKENIPLVLIVYSSFENYEDGIELLDRMLYGPKKISDTELFKMYSLYGAQFYSKTGELEKAVECYERYLAFSDSSHDVMVDRYVETNKAQVEVQIDLEKDRANYEKQKQDLIVRHEQEQHRYTVNLFLGGGIALFIFLIFVINRFYATRKQKRQIEEQKRIVEGAYKELDEKNQEILDSIKYAKRIQNAILPPDERIQEFLKESFVIYLPKDIVAGDFYWLEQKNDTTLLAVADCTGHGVPGALVSVICNNGLNRSVREYNITEPGKILDKTREIVIEEFEKSKDEVKDGMDVALIRLNENSLSYAGANNPLWIYRRDSSSIEETKADKQPIGKHAVSTDYKTSNHQVFEGDCVYIFSDGFADQFGGEKGKKYKISRFRKLLEQLGTLPMEEQKTQILSELGNWMGDHEQVDDICIIGVRF